MQKIVITHTDPFSGWGWGTCLSFFFKW